MIVSVSRRCDIPRFRFGWFLERLDAGFADVVNPFNARQVRRVYFSGEGSGKGSRDTPGSAPYLFRTPGPEHDVSAPPFFVFWTRDPRPILEHGPELVRRGCRFYTMVTLTGYPAILEPNPPPRTEVIAAVKALAKPGSLTNGACFSPETGSAGFPRAETAVIWRYDPVLLSTVTDPEYHRRNFAVLAAALEGAVNRVIISVYDAYAGSRRRLAALSRAGQGGKKGGAGGPGGRQNAAGRFALLPHDDNGRILPEPRQLLAELAATARRHGIVPQSCAEAEDLSELGIKPGACIDPGLVETCAGNYSGGPAGLSGKGLSGKDKNQRPHCLCAESVDIGSYGDCPAGCVYCYARR
jgi:hypothetical protein